MVKTCTLCKKHYTTKEQRSFHLLPRNEERKKKWVEILNLQSPSKSTYICSDHFNKEDIVLDVADRAKLKAEATPLPYYTILPEIKVEHIEEEIEIQAAPQVETIYLQCRMPKKSLYDANSMELAIRDVKSNNTGLRAAAKRYGVPKSTLEFKLKNPGHKDTCGPSPILTFREECQLVKWIEELANRGFPRKKEDILSSVQQFLIENPRPNLFKNNRPGDCWFKAFLRRHPTIVERTSGAVSIASACVSEVDIRKWFKEIHDYLSSKNIDINDPSRIFNGDETGFQICPSTGKVFARKGVKNVYSIDKGTQKESITVMFSFSASGMTCPPMIIYPYKRIPEKIAVTVNSSWSIGRSDNGWMTSEIFHDYIKNIFHPYLIENHVQFPVILFLDGHKSHLTYELGLLCNELNVEVIALYPNATRIMQPCDVAVFRPIKIGWRKAVREFYEQHPGQVLNKITFAPLLETVVTEVVKPETLINGFQACGLFPFNPDAIDYTKCLGKINTLTKITDADPVTLDDKTFMNFVGDDLVAKLKSYDAIMIKEGFNKEFLGLHEIWNYFGKPNKEEDKVDNVKNQTICVESETPNIESEDSRIESEVCKPIHADAEVLEGNKQNLTLNINSISISEPAKLKPVYVFASAIIRQGNNVTEAALPNTVTSASDENLNCINLPDAVNVISVNKNIENTSLTQTSEVPITKNDDDTAHQTSNLPSTSKCIDNYLKIPDKSQRKNKRKTERISFAITSRLYRENFEVKRALKLEEENKKLERKRQSEEKAVAKTNSRNRRVCKSKEVKKDLICFVCERRLPKNRYLTCDTCKNNFHHSCIPNKHKKHVPEINDDDLFLCHICYEEQTDEEPDSEENFEEFGNEEDDCRRDQKCQNEDNNMKQKERQDIDEQNEQEIDELYNIEELCSMYRTEYAKYRY